MPGVLGGVTDPWLLPRREIVDPPPVVVTPKAEPLVEPDDRAEMLEQAQFLDRMDKAGLDAFACNYFGIDLDRRKSLEKLRQEVQALIDDPHAHA